MDSLKVADLTVDEFRKLVREVVIQTLSETLGDPDVETASELSARGS